MTTTETIQAMHRSHEIGEWEGETPEQLLGRCSNCSHAEVHENGDLYVEGPGTGSYLDQDKADKFVEWLKSEGVRLDGLGA